MFYMHNILRLISVTVFKSLSLQSVVPYLENSCKDLDRTRRPFHNNLIATVWIIHSVLLVIIVTYIVRPQRVAVNNFMSKINYIDSTIKRIKVSGVNSVIDANPDKITLPNVLQTVILWTYNLSNVLQRMLL
jgi:hypothetical protein